MLSSLVSDKSGSKPQKSNQNEKADLSTGLFIMKKMSDDRNNQNQRDKSTSVDVSKYLDMSKEKEKSNDRGKVNENVNKILSNMKTSNHGGFHSETNKKISNDIKRIFNNNSKPTTTHRKKEAARKSEDENKKTPQKSIDEQKKDLLKKIEENDNKKTKTNEFSNVKFVQRDEKYLKKLKELNDDPEKYLNMDDKEREKMANDFKRLASQEKGLKNDEKIPYLDESKIYKKPAPKKPDQSQVKKPQPKPQARLKDEHRSMKNDLKAPAGPVQNMIPKSAQSNPEPIKKEKKIIEKIFCFICKKTHASDLHDRNKGFEKKKTLKDDPEPSRKTKEYDPLDNSTKNRPLPPVMNKKHSRNYDEYDEYDYSDDFIDDGNELDPNDFATKELRKITTKFRKNNARYGGRLEPYPRLRDDDYDDEDFEDQDDMEAGFDELEEEEEASRKYAILEDKKQLKYIIKEREEEEYEALRKKKKKLKTK